MEPSSLCILVSILSEPIHATIYPVSSCFLCYLLANHKTHAGLDRVVTFGNVCPTDLLNVNDQADSLEGPTPVIARIQHSPETTQTQTPSHLLFCNLAQ